MQAPAAKRNADDKLELEGKVGLVVGAIGKAYLFDGYVGARGMLAVKATGDSRGRRRDRRQAVDDARREPPELSERREPASGQQLSERREPASGQQLITPTRSSKQ